MLEIRLLGKFAVTADGHPVELPLRAAQSLLAYLALSAGAPHRREQLAGLLWPDADEASARANLRQALWRLRKALGQPDVVMADDLTLMFDPAAEYWLDAQLVGQKLPSTASAETLIAAVSAYGGELLPGFYDNWALLERERLQAAFEQKMEALLDRLLPAQRWDEVLEWAERWIALGHTPEAAYRALITAHGHRGDSAAAAATYRRCVEALQSDLGVEPSALTRTAYARWAQNGSLPPAATAPGDEVRPRNNLPLQLSSFIGREQEIEQVKQHLAQHRLVTLRGSGGIGKTRLCIQTARKLLPDYPQGVWLVELAPVTEASLVPHAVVAALDVREEQGRPLSTTLADYLLGKTALLLLDNCEHVVDACARLAEFLLQRCPDLRILATSRETLGVEGEAVVRVPSLSLPPEDAAGLAASPAVVLAAQQPSEAVRLFVERAAEVLPGFTLTETNAGAVARVCRRLDGVALAIELAAARVALLKVEQIAARLDDAFRLLTGGSRTALPRQQTLRATLDWSYNLLSEPERACLQRLAVFTGSWTLEAAEAVCAGADAGVPVEAVLDLLRQLANKSLVVLEREPGQEARYALLETTRQYGLEKLREAEEEQPARRRHLAYYLKLAKAAELKLYDARQLEGLRQLDAEQSNLRAALGWALERGLEEGLELASALYFYWLLRASWVDGYAWMQKALNACPGAAKPLRARLLAQAGFLAWQRQQATTQSEESIALFREVGDKAGPAYALVTLGEVARFGQDYARAEALVEEGLALYREAGDKWGARHALAYLGLVAGDQGQFDRAGACYQESLALARELGVPDGIGWALTCCGCMAYVQGDYERALALHTESLPFYRAVKEEGLIFLGLYYLMNIAVHLGRLEQAKAFARETLSLVRDMGPTTSWRMSRNGVWPARYIASFVECLALAETGGDPPTIALSLLQVAVQIWGVGQIGKAARLYAAVLAAIIPIRPHSIPLERSEFDQDLTGTLVQLDEADFQRAWAEGSAMTLAEAAAYARQAD